MLRIRSKFLCCGLFWAIAAPSSFSATRERVRIGYSVGLTSGESLLSRRLLEDAGVDADKDMILRVILQAESKVNCG
jgi:hypothetical protein